MKIKTLKEANARVKCLEKAINNALDMLLSDKNDTIITYNKLYQSTYKK